MRIVITTLHMVLLTSIHLYLHLTIEKFGIIKMQKLKVSKALSIFDWTKAFRNNITDDNCEFLTDTLMNIFRVDEHFDHLCDKTMIDTCEKVL